MTPSLEIDAQSLPENNAMISVADCLARAHAEYGNKRLGGEICRIDSYNAIILLSFYSAVILFVVQPGERNLFDQRWIEWCLKERLTV